jgi:hypothetical protein
MDTIITLLQQLGLFFAGYNFKEKKKDYLKDPGLLKSISFVCKITDTDLFNEHFPNYDNIQKMQPGWTYLPSKGIIKINLEIVDYFNNLGFFDYTFDEFLNIIKNGEYLIDIDTELFKTFGNVYIYIEYNNSLNNSGLVNVYTKGDEILSTHFSKKVKHKNFNAYIQNKNCTRFVKSFLNNDSITPEKILCYYSVSEKPSYYSVSEKPSYKKCKLKLVYPYKTIHYKNNQQIEF